MTSHNISQVVHAPPLQSEVATAVHVSSTQASFTQGWTDN